MRAFDGVSKPRRALLAVLVATIALLVAWLLVEASDDAAAILAAGITAAGAITVGVLTRRSAAQAAAVASHRAEVGPIYEEIVQRYFSLLPRRWRGETPLPRRTADEPLSEPALELLDFLDEATQKLLIWGSPSVIEGWMAYRRALAQHIPGVTTDPYIGLDAWEELLLVFRRDLGHDDRRLSKRDLLRIFFSDDDDPEAGASDDAPPPTV